MLSKNKEYVVDIVDIGQGGVGIGKYEGFTVFVEGGLIQDKVKVRINKSKKNYAVGDIVEIIEKSPFRVDRICSDDLKDCGGCQIQELESILKTMVLELCIFLLLDNLVLNLYHIINQC